MGFTNRIKNYKKKLNHTDPKQKQTKKYKFGV